MRSADTTSEAKIISQGLQAYRSISVVVQNLNGVLNMADKSLQQIHDEHRAHRVSDEDRDWYEKSMKNWRAWGSWFSWGSPVGLSIFFLALVGCIWVLFHLK